MSPARAYVLRQAMVETSNVTMASEMVGMMAAVREAETGAKLVQVYDDLMGRALTAFGQGGKMSGAFYIGAVGLESQQQALDIIANNIAILNTPAFKRSQVRFQRGYGKPGRHRAGTANGSGQPHAASRRGRPVPSS